MAHGANPNSINKDG